MKKLIAIVACLGLLLFAGSGSATVITFDDVTSNLGFIQIPTSQYSDFTFGASGNAFYVVDDATFGNAFYGNNYGSPSGDYAAFNGYGTHEIAVTSTAGLFTFSGADFTGWAQYDAPAADGWTATSIDIEGFEGAVSKYSALLDLSANSYTWFGANWENIDKVVFSYTGEVEKYWLMDNFTYEPYVENGNGEVPIPEPATLILLGLGLIGLRFARKR